MLYTDILQKRTSKLIMGTDYMGTVVPSGEVMKLFDCYYDIGGNHFDTAHLYCGGESERLVGKWLKTRKRDDIFVSTKGGHPPLSDMSASRLDEKNIRLDIEESLARLDEEYVDLYYLHRDDVNRPAGEIIETLNKLIKEGKTRGIGCSNWKASRIQEANDYAKKHNLQGFMVSQIKWSLAKTSESFLDDPTLVEMDDKELAFYENSDIKVVAFSSQAKGFFSKYADNRLEGKAEERYLCEKNIARFNAAKEIASERGVSVASVVISYIISQQKIDAMPIVGCKNTSQLKDTTKYCDLILTSDELDKLEI